MRRSFAAAVALATVVSSAARGAELTVVPNGISGCTTVAEGGGGVVDDPADFIQTPTPPDGLDVAVSATASDGIGFPGLYIGSFNYSCTLLGAGRLEYGALSGALELSASSTPDELPPDVANMGNPPFRNDGRASGNALLTMQFDDSGTVESDTLPDGTPVTIQLVFSVESIAILIGEPGSVRTASATYNVRANEVDPPGNDVQRLLLGNEIMTVPLDTEVGRTIDLQGRLALAVTALAGREVEAAPYAPQAEAQIQAGNTALFQMELPAGVRFDADSGHDYTEAPEPAQALALAAGALALGTVRARRRRGAAPGVAPALHLDAR